MSNTSVRPIPTLKGIFSVPRATQGRNFLKENKVSLRSLEKTTSEKLAAKEPVRPKWMPPMRRAGSEVRESKAGRPPVTRQNTQETSLTRNRNNSRSHHQLGACAPESGERFEGLEERNPVFYAPSVEAAQSPDNYSERCNSCGTQRSSTSIAIQTEDITDELYLTNALKKCSIDGSMMGEPSNKYDNGYRRSNRYDDEEDLLSPRTNGKQQSRFNVNEFNTMPLAHDDDLKTEVASDEEAPLSARSRYTVATVESNASTTSKRREHKLGSRDEVRLPRYLEKEKREKAAAKELADARDPDCPRGHILLPEQERVDHLHSAQKRYDGLISELNHMPMTAQTLRVRNRKSEIDKELAVVDEEIRLYSKPKVYISSSKNN